MPGAPWRTRHPSRYSAQLASGMQSPGAVSNAAAGVGATTIAGALAVSGALVFAGAFEWASPCDLPGAAAAVEGPTLIAAITAASAMIPALRLPDFVFAISTSLSRGTFCAPPQLVRRAHSASGAAPLRPPSGGGAGAFHSFGGSVQRRKGATTRSPPIARKKVSAAASQLEQHLPWQPRRQATSRRGFFRERSGSLREP
jgi:hypothetical protein